jgi:hypothetical protein
VPHLPTLPEKILRTVPFPSHVEHFIGKGMNNKINPITTTIAIKIIQGLELDDLLSSVFAIGLACSLQDVISASVIVKSRFPSVKGIFCFG